MRWFSSIQDLSAVTSASVFDFEGDGSAEIVYRDEVYLRVFRGNDGKVLFQLKMTSNTVNEEPIVADIDNDGHAEIVVSSDANINIPPPLTRGLFVIEDANDSWVRARRIWNQHTYHITNICEDGSIPLHEQANWLVPGLNNFRMNGFERGCGEEGRADRFSYKANDGNSDSNEASVSVLLLPKNSTPEIVSTPVDRATAHFDYTYPAAASDPDAGDVLTFSLPTAPAGMTIVPDTGLIQWAPTDQQIGSHSVTVKVSDQQNFFALQGFAVNVELPVTVPDVVGLTRSAAESTIVSADLLVGTVSQEHSSSVPSGSVVSQNPAGGVEAARGSTVELVESSGPAPEDVDNDGDGFTENQGDCNDSDPAVHPGATELCDAVDNNCDSNVDENLGQTSCGVGICQHSVQNCVNGLPQSCDSLQGAGAEICDGLDNDCDGAADEDLGETSCGLGVCAHTVQNCAAGISQACEPLQGASLESCDGLDNDCDGAVDEDLGQTTCGVGACQRSVESCLGGVTQICTPGAPVAEICGNGIDDDCNGMVDEASVCDAMNVDHDQDGYTENQGDCNDNDASIHPGAFDIPDNGIDENCNGADAVAGDDTPPTVSLVSPDDDAEVMLPTDLIGTADDDHLLRYSLELARVGDSAFSRFATGTARVVDGVLGELDPTLLENGMYRVRLTAEDANGLTASTEKVVRITGEAKIGVLVFSFVDLSIPVSGIPVTLIRSYDSRVKTREDFGVGWRLDVKRGSYENNRKPGDGWKILKGEGSFGLPCQVVDETKRHITEVRLSDREVYRFKFAPVNFAPLTGGCQGEAQFEFVSGPTPDARLDIFGSLTVLSRDGGNELIDVDTLTTYNPREVQLSLADGRKIDFDPQGINHIQDSNGNAISISADGIVHSSGKSITFDRDQAGRITQVTDPMGHTLNYGYDDSGDLVAFIDQSGNRTEFSYDDRHNILEIRDPLGNRPMQSEYDSNGRLIAILDGRGNRITFAHDVPGREEIVTDSRGNVTRLVYNDNGYIVQKQQSITIEGVPTTATTLREFDALGNETASTDPDERRTAATYDGENLLTQILDPLGLALQTSYTYNARGEILSQSDPAGNSTAVTYDTRGNPTRITDSLGNAITIAYDNLGRPIQRTEPLGTVTRFTYDTFGNITREEQQDSLGSILSRRDFTYDANGNQLTETFLRTIDGTLRTLTIGYTYDAKNRRVATVDPEGHISRIEYNALGLESARVDALGHRTTFTYDSAGALIRTDYADGTFETQDYDASGNIIRKTDQSGRTTNFQYDEANRQIRVDLPDGSSNATVYSPGGRREAVIDANGNRTDFEYDAVGRRVRVLLPEVFDAVQGALTRPEQIDEYDAAGNRVATVDANGNRTTFSYNAAHQLTQIVAANGTKRVNRYDAQRRRIELEDEAGQKTQFAYDALSRLVKVTDATGAITTYSYDEADHTVSQTDALGNLTRFTYDPVGRRVSKILPLGQTETRTYDAVGNLVTLQNFNGMTATYTYDELGRVTENSLPDGTTLSYTYTPTGKPETLSDGDGITSILYDELDRPIRVQYPSGEALSYAYDARGNRTTVTTPGGITAFEYDANDRLSAVTDPETRRTTYEYDAGGNPVRVNHPNGTTTVYNYDVLNRLVAVNHLNGATETGSYVYTLGPAGNRTRVVEHSGRSVDYSYDSLLRLTGEAITLPGSGSTGYSYTYDAAGNRLSRTGPGGTTTYLYDANSRLTDAGDTTYTYDGNGNRLSSADPNGATGYQYDSLNRLIQATAQDGEITLYDYDVFNNRVRSLNNSDRVDYLVDPFDLSGLPQVLRETDAQGNALAEYVYGLDLISRKAGPSVNFYRFDGQQSTRQLTDSAGAVTDTFDYDAFGILLTRSGTATNNYLYNGQQFDPKLGSYYLRARYYDPSVGRFLVRDPIEGNMFQPVTLSPYIYASNDPVNRSDPSGEETTITETLGAFQGAVDLSFTINAAASGAGVLAAAAAAVCTVNYGVSYVVTEYGGLDIPPGPCRYNPPNEMQIRFEIEEYKRGDRRLSQVSGEFIDNLVSPVRILSWNSSALGGVNPGVTSRVVGLYLTVLELDERLNAIEYGHLIESILSHVYAGGVAAEDPDPLSVVARAFNRNFSVVNVRGLNLRQ
ncbi:MAG: MopE-related protein [Gammaproteobacteria bacterium]